MRVSAAARCSVLGTLCLVEATLLAHAAAGNQQDVGLDVSSDGREFAVTVGGATWFINAATFLQANSASHELILTNFSGAATGTDSQMGAFSEYRWSWTTGGHPPVVMDTTAKVFDDHPSILWTQEFPDGVAEFGYGDAIDLSMRKEPNWGTAASGWPAVALRDGQAVDFVTFLGDGNAEFGSGLGSSTIPVERGAAIGYFNESGYTLVISPASSFLSSVISSTQSKVLRCGVQGAATSLPPGHATSFIMHAGQGVPETFMSWGSQLLAMYNKPRPSPRSSVSLQYLGYSTTGAYFYAHRKNETYAQTLLAVKAEAEARKIPYKWMLIDSWWYHENAVPGPRNEGICFEGFGGTTWQWDSKPIPPARNCSGNFPGGWRAFAKQLGLPFMMHISEWAGRKVSGKKATPNPYGPPPYSLADPKGWIVEDACSAPQTVEFWDQIFGDMSTHGGLAVYKQDHGGGEIVQLEAAQRNVSVMENWLRPQAIAAAKHNVSKMLCGSISSFWMQSVEIAAATHTRAGNDYLTGITRPEDVCQKPNANVFAGRVSNAEIGMSNLINWAVGLYPYKDTFLSTHQDWSTSTCTMTPMHGTSTGSVLPPYYGAQEKHPELQALVSALSAGPIAPSDVVGSSNSTLILSTCRADGVLLKPDRPAFPPGVMFLRRLRGKGEVQVTYTTLADAGRWTYCLSFGMKEQITLTSQELGVSTSLGDRSGSDSDSRTDSSGIAWVRRNLEPFDVSMDGEELHRFSPSEPLSLPMQPPAGDWGLYTYWRTAPTSCQGQGWTLLGEVKKLISVSAQRFANVTVTCGTAAHGREPTLSVTILGTEGESVAVSFVQPRPSKRVVTVQLKLHDGTSARVLCSGITCAQNDAPRIAKAERST